MILHNAPCDVILWRSYDSIVIHYVVYTLSIHVNSAKLYETLELTSFPEDPEPGLNRIELFLLDLFAWSTKDHLALEFPGTRDVPSFCNLVINQWVVVLQACA